MSPIFPIPIATEEVTSIGTEIRRPRKAQALGRSKDFHRQIEVKSFLVKTKE
jgi:hypothetical protein